jgi:hypothetical protein
MRSRCPDGVFEDRVVRVQCEPPLLVVLPGDLGRCLGCPEKGVPVR